MTPDRVAQLFPHLIAVVLFFAFSADACGENRVHLIRGYEGQRLYADAAVGESEEVRAELYERFVKKPYHECAQDVPSEDEKMVDSRFSVPIINIESLSATIDAIESNNVDTRVIETANSAATLLDAEDITICLFAYHPEGPEYSFVVGPAGGVMGFAFFGRGVMWAEVLLLDDVEMDDWLVQIDYLIAHELHHAVGEQRTRVAIDGMPLLDFILAEGRADVFAEAMYPGKEPSPWSSALSVTEESDVWAQMKADLGSKDEALIGNYMFGSKEKGIPTWSGYTIGFRIVKSYLASHPNATVQDWTYITADKLLRESGYDTASLRERQ